MHRPARRLGKRERERARERERSRQRARSNVRAPANTTRIVLPVLIFHLLLPLASGIFVTSERLHKLLVTTVNASMLERINACTHEYRRTLCHGFRERMEELGKEKGKGEGKKCSLCCLLCSGARRGTVQLLSARYEIDTRNARGACRHSSNS